MSAPGAAGVVDDFAGSYKRAAWFKESGGDLRFGVWLLGMCHEVRNTQPLQSTKATYRAHKLYRMHQRLRRELLPTPKPKHVLWTPEEIANETYRLIQFIRNKSTKQLDRAARKRKRANAKVERILLGRIVRDATKLMLLRATSAHESLLQRWLQVLQGKEGKDYGVVVYQTASGETKQHPLLPADTTTLRQELVWLKSPKSNHYNDTQVWDDVNCFLSMVSDWNFMRPQAQVAAATIPLNAKSLWMLEMQQFAQLDVDGEEERRQLVAHDIRSVLRENVDKWANCDVVLFGSSYSRYGLPDSDLDLSLLPDGRNTSTDTGSHIKERSLIDKDVMDWREPATDGERVEQLHEMCARVFQRVQDLDKAFQEMIHAGKYTPERMQQWRQLEFLDNEMRLLYNGIMAELSALPNAVDPPYSKASIVAAPRQHVLDDLDLVRRTLQSCTNCDVREVVHGARVPIVRFAHRRNGEEYDCDLSINNRLATRNTLLLRAYASFDDRARVLGCAIKHWGKHRSIVGTVHGFLSSYSLVLLTIYYLQLVDVLPNLQDPRLLVYAQVTPECYGRTNVAFCADVDVARAFFEPTCARSDSLEMPLTTLLVGFFEFYAVHFDYANRVVTVRSPTTPTPKTVLWGPEHAKATCLSIQDPLQTSRDLGGVLHEPQHEATIQELRRAHEMLMQGLSFAEVCGVP